MSVYEYRSAPTKIKYLDIAEHMRQNPGTWIKVRTAPTLNAASAASQQIKNGVRAAFRPAGAFDSYTQGLDVIAAYVGGGANE